MQFHSASGADMDDIMRMMMGGGMGGMGGQRRQRKGRDVGMAYPVTLEDLYNGKKATLPRERQVLTANKMSTKTVDAPLKVTIEKGMEHEQQIPFMNQGDEHPQIDIPGHIVVVLQQLKHQTFTRQGDDLKMTQKISLAEALCGFQFTITHMDGRQLLVESQQGEMIKPGDKKAIIGEGMPKHKRPTQFGDLIIEFEVEFPSTLMDESIEQLRKALPPPAKMDADYDPSEAYPCTLQPQPIDEVKKEMEKQAAEDEDDDEEGGAGGVQCAQS